jgi:predicted nucleic acid-binding protein
VIYADSSALFKLTRVERETAALRTWLAAPATSLASSSLALVEVVRSARRLEDGEALARAHDVLAAVDLLPLDDDVLSLAGTVGGPRLRSLDAIHLASALSIKPFLDAFIAYDDRLHEAALAAGLPAIQPGW